MTAPSQSDSEPRTAEVSGDAREDVQRTEHQPRAAYGLVERAHDHGRVPRHRRVAQHAEEREPQEKRDQAGSSIAEQSQRVGETHGDPWLGDDEATRRLLQHREQHYHDEPKATQQQEGDLPRPDVVQERQPKVQ